MNRSRLICAVLVVALLSWPPTMLGQRLPTRSRDLEWPTGDRVRVIVQADRGALAILGRRFPGGLRRQLERASVLELTRSEFETLVRDTSIAHVSRDVPVAAATNIAATRPGAGGLSTGSRPRNADSTSDSSAGIGVAVIDSGIAPHSAIGNRVIARVDFASTGPPAPDDPFGHGTQVAATIAGVNANGITPYGDRDGSSLRFVDVRVLDRDGVGHTSDVVAGIEWVIANRARYGIRIINLSAGHPVTEAASTDPLCIAVSRAVDSGIVVVAPAGNYGMTSSGALVLGGITSPGNSPSAITVGAVDTKDTASTSDDVVAAYSSRGPTPIDLALKPDVVAAVPRRASLEWPDAEVATRDRRQPRGSSIDEHSGVGGTSLAAAVVTGGVVRLLEAQPSLSPARVKTALQGGATFLSAAGLVGGGAGSVDLVRSLKLVRPDVLESLLKISIDSPGFPAGGASFVDRGTLIDRLYDRTGLRSVGPLDIDSLIAASDTARSGVLNLIGESNPLGQMPVNYLVWGSIAGFTSNYYVFWGSTIRAPNGEYLVWGTSASTPTTLPRPLRGSR